MTPKPPVPSSTAPQRLESGSVSAGPSTGQHLVQFYDDDATLIDALGTYVSDGMAAREPAVVILTERHRQALVSRLLDSGLDAARLRDHDELHLLDVDETLARLTSADGLTEPRFVEIVAASLRAAAARHPGARIRVFGEMVAVLWRAGHHDTAIRLEVFWNRLSGMPPFTMFCAYPKRSFEGGAHRDAFLRICSQHTSVVPPEAVAPVTGADDRLRTIGQLQQRLTALEMEVAELRAAEDDLRQRERALAHFLENATDGLQDVAPTGEILWANRAQLVTVGLGRDQYVGRQVDEFLGEAGVYRGIWSRLVRGETVGEVATRLRLLDGSELDVVLHSCTLHGAGARLHVRSFVRRSGPIA